MKTDQEIKQAADFHCKEASWTSLSPHIVARHSFIAGAEFATPSWIPVEEALPEETRECLFIVDLLGHFYHGRVYGGHYTGDPTSKHHRNEFSTPGWGVPASHWMYSPISIVPLPDDANRAK